VARKTVVRDLALEEMLQERGFAWEMYPGLTANKFDRAASLHNQARLSQPLDDGQVETYVNALKNGDKFPPIVATWTGRRNESLLMVVDGNHRLEAHARERKPLNVYVISGQQAGIIALMFEANAKHGLPISADDRIHGALYLAESGMPIGEAAKRMGLTSSQLNKASALHRGSARAAAVGIHPDDWDRKISPVNRQRLVTAATDEGFLAAAQLTIDGKLSTPQVVAMISTMNGIRSSNGQVDFVKNLRETEHAERVQTRGMSATKGARGRGRTPKQRVMMALGQTVSLPSPEELCVTLVASEKVTVLEKLSAAVDRLAALRDAVARA
jgi:hypothetical protein